MKEMKKEVRELLSIKQEFVGLCTDPSLLVGLKEALTHLEAKWSGLQEAFGRRLPEAGDLTELDLSSEDGYRLSSTTNSLNSSVGEEGMVLQEFRAAFQEVSAWLDTAEHQLGRRSRRPSEDRQLGAQLLNLQPKVESLGAMAVRIVETYTTQRPDVEPEMELLGHRWENIVAKIEKSSNFSVVEVEQIRTTISHLTIPPPRPVITSGGGVTTSEPEEIATLPEEGATLERRLLQESSRDSSPEFFSASPRTPRSPDKTVSPRSRLTSPRSPYMSPRSQDSSAASSTDKSVSPRTTSEDASRKSSSVDQRSSSSPDRNGTDISLETTTLKESLPPAGKPSCSPPVKTPPPTKPKPRWYVESLREKRPSSPTLPSTCSVQPVQQAGQIVMRDCHVTF